MKITEALEAIHYPGRGIVAGRTADGGSAALCYFIMGRSQNSRNRIFIEDGDGIRTEAFDPSKMEDPSLIIYSPVRVLGNYTIVTNGDQTDSIVKGLDDLKTPELSLLERNFEPDAPNYTPRISCVARVSNGRLYYQLSILKSRDGDPSSCRRFFYYYENALPGEGHLIHTYARDVGQGDPLPSFEGEPKAVSLEGDLDELADSVWGALDSDNKVSLFVRLIDLRNGEARTKIINKNH